MIFTNFYPTCCSLLKAYAQNQACWCSVGLPSAPASVLETVHLPTELSLGVGLRLFSPRLSKPTKVSLRQMANISSFLTSVKTSKSTFMTFHIAFFYIPLKGHGILMSLASIIFICHVLLSQYNKLTKAGGLLNKWYKQFWNGRRGKEN